MTVTWEQMREGINDLPLGKPAPRCRWDCPPEVHSFFGKEIPDQRTRFVVYGFFTHDGRCLYVGQTRDLSGRCYQHAIGYTEHFFHAAEIRILAGAASRERARRLEREHIRRLDPAFNILHSPSNHRRKSA